MIMKPASLPSCRNHHDTGQTAQGTDWTFGAESASESIGPTYGMVINF